MIILAPMIQAAVSATASRIFVINETITGVCSLSINGQTECVNVFLREIRQQSAAISPSPLDELYAPWHADDDLSEFLKVMAETH